MTNLRISSDFALPAEAVTETFAILAKRGVGKTYTASVLVEELLKAGLRTVVVDPVGVWWGLRASADGKRPGLPIVILGGDHGDVPLELAAGQVIADLVVDEGISAVLDLSHLRKGEQTRFMTDFAERLYHRNRAPLQLVLDEADAFCMTANTEILTPGGWKGWQQVRPGDLVVAFDLLAGEYRDEPIQRVIVRDYEGDMVSLKTKGLDCLVTPDHRVVLRRVQRAQGRYGIYDWTFCPAEQVPTSIQIPVGGAPAGPGIPGLSEELLRIMGWIITDGYIHDKRKSHNLGLQQSVTTIKRGQSMVNEMDKVLLANGVSRSERPARSYAGIDRDRQNAPAVAYYLGVDLSSQLNAWLGDDIHRIPRRLLQECSPQQLQALFQGLLEGDGTARNGGWHAFTPGNNEGLADDFQEIATRLGISTTKSYVPSIQQWHVHINSRKHHWVRRPQRARYAGIVWDITVPSGAFVARRNGRIFVTGNCPQRPIKGQERMLGAIDDLVRRGQARGIGVTLVIQRSAVLNKDVLTQIEVLVALRTIAPQDREAIDAWIKVHGTPAQREELMSSLPSLPIGTAWFWSPGWLDVFRRVQVRQRETFDSSATPKVGAQIQPPRQLAPIDIEKLRERIAATVEQANADDPRELRRRIVDLEKQLASRTPAPKVEKVVECVEVPAIGDAQLRSLEETVATLAEVGGQLVTIAQDLGAALARVAAPTAQGAPVAPLVSSAALARPTTPTRTTPALQTTAPTNSTMPDGEWAPRAGERKMLMVLAQRYPMKFTRTQLGTLAGYTASGGTFGAYYGALKRHGLLQESGGEVQITPAGLDELGAGVPPQPQTSEELRSMWQGVLRGGERKMLDALIAVYPTALTREDLGERTGYTASGGTFGAYLGTLRRNGLVEVDGGEVRASAGLFAGGAASI